ncbi:hypothetical protein GCM10010466_31910 [Planomonospora alba]|uniref:Uncharacterized protein n=1 Tax=Planomonospora alba TaxID=161354 RepID=A0ABP6N7D7_9ACTN
MREGAVAPEKGRDADRQDPGAEGRPRASRAPAPGLPGPTGLPGPGLPERSPPGPRGTAVPADLAVGPWPAAAAVLPVSPGKSHGRDYPRESQGYEPLAKGPETRSPRGEDGSPPPRSGRRDR